MNRVGFQLAGRVSIAETRPILVLESPLLHSFSYERKFKEVLCCYDDGRREAISRCTGIVSFPWPSIRKQRSYSHAGKMIRRGTCTILLKWLYVVTVVTSNGDYAHGTGP